MKNFHLVSQGVNVTPLVLDLLRQPDLWAADTYLRDLPGHPFAAMDTVFLRFPPVSATVEERAARDPHESINRPEQARLPHARPLFMGLAAQLGAERVGRVMINRLAPGARIEAHADTPAHAAYWDRFHVVLQGEPGSTFRCGPERVCMKTGEVWWFQNAVEHEVVNHSADDRLHLIVDLRLKG